MTVKNLKALYEHFCFIASGKWNERNFDKDIGDEGRITMGKMTPERVKLIISDATQNKLRMEEKHPHLFPAKKAEVKDGDN